MMHKTSGHEDPRAPLLNGTATDAKVAHPHRRSDDQLKPSAFRELLIFSFIGIVNTVIDLAVLNILIWFTHTGQSGFRYTEYKTISFLAALLNSYLLNRHWTFAKVPKKRMGPEAVQFFLVSVVGAALNIGSASVVASYLHPGLGLEKYWPSISALSGTLWGLVFNFVGYKYLVFSGRRSPGGDLLPASPEEPLAYTDRA